MNRISFISLDHGANSTERNNILIGILLLVSISFCESQDNEEIRFFKSFFNQHDFNKLEKFIYVKGISKFEIEDVRKSIKNDTIFSPNYKNDPNGDLLILTKQDRAEIDNQLNSLNSNDWYENLHLENSQSILRDSIDAIFDPDPAVGWAYFYKKYGLKFYRFSKPILFRHNTLCLFYFSSYCSPFCGEGTVMLFKKEQGNWVKWLTLYGWIS